MSDLSVSARDAIERLQKEHQIRHNSLAIAISCRGTECWEQIAEEAYIAGRQDEQAQHGGSAA